MANMPSRLTGPRIVLACLPLAALGCSSGNGVEGDTSASGGGTSAGGNAATGVSATGGSVYVAQTSTSTGTSTDTTTGAGTPGTGCAQQSVPIKALPPDILIIQDRSLSMTDDSNVGHALEGRL